jgi:hypothetical protein
MTKAFKIAQSPKRAKSHVIYSARDVMALYEISRNTLLNWEKAGLKVVPRPSHPALNGKFGKLYRGCDLNAFHKQRQLDRARLAMPGEFYCLPCRAHMAMTGLSVSLCTVTGRGGRVTWTCPECESSAVLTMSGPRIDSHIAAGVHIARSL